MGKTQIIDSSDSGIVLKETNISVSDEKLKNLLSKAYEKAELNSLKFRFYNLYGVSFSIAGTLLLSLLTSSFNSIGSLNGYKVELIAIIICILSFIFGVVCLFCKSSFKAKNFTTESDEAVGEILSQNKLVSSLNEQKSGD